MAFVESFRGLEVYKLSRRLSKEIFEISQSISQGRNVLVDRPGAAIIAICRRSNSGGVG